MNKIVLGSALVAVMGGVPGATYLLTRKEETTTSKGEEHSGSSDSHSGAPAVAKGNSGSDGQPASACPTSGDSETCTGQTELPSR